MPQHCYASSLSQDGVRLTLTRCPRTHRGSNRFSVGTKVKAQRMPRLMMLTSRPILSEFTTMRPCRLGGFWVKSDLSRVAKRHPGLSVPLLPAIEIAEPVASRAAQVLTNLCVVVKTIVVSLIHSFPGGLAIQRFPLSCRSKHLQVLIRSGR